MICSVRTLGISGLRGSAVTAECFISNGLPGFDIVGLPDTAVKEARERVRAAIKTAGMSFPPSRITVNLAPANLKKAGTHYDLPILLGILIASGQVRRPRGKWAFLRVEKILRWAARWELFPIYRSLHRNLPTRCWQSFWRWTAT